MSIKDVWFRFLAAIARNDDMAPGLGDTSPDAPKADMKSKDETYADGGQHTWKSHGGDRH